MLLSEKRFIDCFFLSSEASLDAELPKRAIKGFKETDGLVLLFFNMKSLLLVLLLLLVVVIVLVVLCACQH